MHDRASIRGHLTLGNRTQNFQMAANCLHGAFARFMRFFGGYGHHISGWNGCVHSKALIRKQGHAAKGEGSQPFEIFKTHQSLSFPVPQSLGTVIFDPCDAISK